MTARSRRSFLKNTVGALSVAVRDADVDLMRPGRRELRDERGLVGTGCLDAGLAELAVAVGVPCVVELAAAVGVVGEGGELDVAVRARREAAGGQEDVRRVTARGDGQLLDRRGVAALRGRRRLRRSHRGRRQ